jgi:hypothetical protein
MNPEKGQPDASLDRALREWRPSVSLAPRFNERVWQRIVRQEAEIPAALWLRCAQWLNGVFARPSLAVTYVSTLLLAGLLAGYWHARHDNTQASEELSARYVRLMDPYQMPRH